MYKDKYSVERMCRVLKVSRSCFYRWFSGSISKRSLENKKITTVIQKVFEDSRKTYGSPRIQASLNNLGYVVSRRRVSRLMQINGWKSKIKGKYKVTTNSKHAHFISDNHLNRNFKPDGLNRAWVSDITYIRTAEGWLYLTTIIDLFDRQVIGWSLSRTLFTNQTIIPAWKMALSKREITQPLIFHSDRGVQYASKEFRKHLKKNCLILQSMSRKGNCWDNAVSESFFKTLKTELIYHDHYKTIEQAKSAVFEYIETWYNRKRLHSALGYKTPAQIEQEFINMKNVA
jgi:transposase InsO family protein